MPRTILFSLALVLMLGAFSPAAEEPASDAEKLEAGLKTWEKLKEKCEGNYSYEIRFSSFAGFGHVTEVVVKNNKVAERKFKKFNTRQTIPTETPKPAVEWAWQETGKEIGTHLEGAAAKTLDELYQAAQKVVEQKLAPHERRYVRLDKQGLPTTCFIIDTRIADDAPRKGVAISNIKLSQTK